MPLLEAAIKEALRLHPPLILLLRVAQVDIDVAGHRIPAGTMVGASPSVSNRLPEVFDDAEAFDPSRYVIPREDDVARSEEHTSELQSLMRISYAVFCLKKRQETTN